MKRKRSNAERLNTLLKAVQRETLRAIKDSRMDVYRELETASDAMSRACGVQKGLDDLMEDSRIHWTAELVRNGEGA